MRSILTFCVFLMCTLLSGAQSHQQGSPGWIVESFFTQTTFPTADQFYTGEMRRYLENPPMGAYVPPGYSQKIDILLESADSAIYRFSYSNSERAGDWYAFLVREEEVWKLSAVRTLAIPRFVRELRDSLRAKETRDEKEESELAKMDLMFSSDIELKAYLSNHIASFESIADRLVAGKSAEDLKSVSGRSKPAS